MNLVKRFILFGLVFFLINLTSFSTALHAADEDKSASNISPIVLPLIYGELCAKETRKQAKTLLVARR